MTDISTIPMETLEKDLQDSRNDIATCEVALSIGVTSYSGGSVTERLEANKGFVKVISEEIERRAMKEAT